MLTEREILVCGRLEAFAPRTAQIKEIRPVQKQALAQIAEALKTEDRLVVSGPTGIGKSFLIVTCANMFKALGHRVTITSPLNVLVDQMQSSFSEQVETLKGKEHYNCECSRRLGKTAKCSESFCAVNQCGTAYIQKLKNLGAQRSVTATKRNCADCKAECICNSCPYHHARNKYLSASIGNTNYSMFMLGLRESTVYIVDECQLSEQFIRMTVGVTISEEWPEDLGWRQYLELLVETKAEKEAELKLKMRSLELCDVAEEGLRAVKSLEKISRAIAGITKIIEDYGVYKEPWVAVFEEKEDWKTKIVTHSVRFEPITTLRFEMAQYMPGTKILYFSATPSTPKHINGTPWKLLELPSPFPAEIRPWSYYPIGSMNFKSRAKTTPKMAEFINGISKKRPGKILVHCQSYQIANELGRHCKEKLGNYNVIVQVPGSAVLDAAGNEVQNRNRSLQNFLSSSNNNTIFFSVNFWEGIDLYQHDGREAVFTQVIAKVPFRFQNDPVLKAQRKLNPASSEETVNARIADSVTQGYGRINRNMEKWEKAKRKTLTLILDSDFKSWGWYEENKHLFREYFKEAEIYREDINWSC